VKDKFDILTQIFYREAMKGISDESLHRKPSPLDPYKM
jgi:hypothetical protein